jgi:hypothetical protein
MKTQLHTTDGYRKNPFLKPGAPRKDNILPKLLLIDDEPIFGRIMVAEAQKRGIFLYHCSSLQNFSEISHSDFEAVIMDYDLGDCVTGCDLAQFIGDTIHKCLPILLISQSRLQEKKVKSGNIIGFTHKSEGAGIVLNRTLDFLKTLSPGVK